MRFGVKRLDLSPGGAPPYHLFDDRGMLVLVADQDSPWLSDARRHVRFAAPDGQAVATLDLPHKTTGRLRSNVRQCNYALIIDHAVYAIINTHEPEVEPSDVSPYVTVEVEGERFLLCRLANGAGETYGLFDEVPDGLSLYHDVDLEELSEPVATIRPEAAGYDFSIEILPGQFRQMALMSLALTFLLDRQPDPARPSA